MLSVIRWRVFVVFFRELNHDYKTM